MGKVYRRLMTDAVCEQFFFPGHTIALKTTGRGLLRLHTSGANPVTDAVELSDKPCFPSTQKDFVNTRKSMSQLITLLHVLDCDVDLVVKRKAAA